MTGHTLKIRAVDTIIDKYRIYMKKNVYQTKYWHNYFNCVNISISKIFHTCPQILKLQNDSKGVTT